MELRDSQPRAKTATKAKHSRDQEGVGHEWFAIKGDVHKCYDMSTVGGGSYLLDCELSSLHGTTG